MLPAGVCHLRSLELALVDERAVPAKTADWLKAGLFRIQTGETTDLSTALGLSRRDARTYARWLRDSNLWRAYRTFGASIQSFADHITQFISELPDSEAGHGDFIASTSVDAYLLSALVYGGGELPHSKAQLSKIIKTFREHTPLARQPIDNPEISRNNSSENFGE